MTRTFEAELGLLLRTIANWRQAHGYAPSVRELTEFTKASTSVVQYRLLTLEKRNLIERTMFTARSIRLTEQGERAVREQEDAISAA